MEYNSDFKYDLEIGKEGERIVHEIFANKKLEVKRDSWVGRSGNIAIEFKSRNKPSGISTTQADYWVFIFSKDKKQISALESESKNIEACSTTQEFLRKLSSLDLDNTHLICLSNGSFDGIHQAILERI